MKNKKLGEIDYWEVRWNKRKKINIFMEGNWDDIDNIIALLKYWKYCGGVGHSASVSFSMDGDGTSHPKFLINDKPLEDYKNKFWKIEKDEYKKKENSDNITNEDLK